MTNEKLTTPEDYIAKDLLGAYEVYKHLEAFFKQDCLVEYKTPYSEKRYESNKILSDAIYLVKERYIEKPVISIENTHGKKKIIFNNGDNNNE